MQRLADGGAVAMSGDVENVEVNSFSTIFSKLPTILRQEDDRLRPPLSYRTMIF